MDPPGTAADVGPGAAARAGVAMHRARRQARALVESIGEIRATWVAQKCDAQECAYGKAPGTPEALREALVTQSGELRETREATIEAREAQARAFGATRRLWVAQVSSLEGLCELFAAHIRSLDRQDQEDRRRGVDMKYNAQVHARADERSAAQKKLDDFVTKKTAARGELEKAKAGEAEVRDTARALREAEALRMKTTE